jgi:hypothetical protein
MHDYNYEAPLSVNPCDPGYWRGRALRHTLHAEERCFLRDLPFLHYLPADACLADRDLDARGQLEAVTFKVPWQDRAFFVVLATDGDIITLFEKDDAFAEKQALKERRRRQQCWR